MFKKVFSLLAMMLLATACQPQAGDNNQNSADSTEQMTDTDMQRGHGKKAMDQNGRSRTRSRMKDSGGSNSGNCNSCGSCGSCGGCSEPEPACEKSCGPCCDNQSVEESTEAAAL